jgi:DNA-directed RNA polymerase subunit H (RpoH/RPB5)
MDEIVTTFITLKEMLNDRHIDTENLNHISDIELSVLAKTNPIFSIKILENLSVIYYLSSKFKISDLKKYIPDGGKVIIIFKEKINNLNIKNIKESAKNGLEIFMMKELMFNISKHYLVPKHEVIKDDELLKVIDVYKIKQKSQLPIILKSDPMARYHDINPGEIVKITRPSPSAGETIVYRYCV